MRDGSKWRTPRAQRLRIAAAFGDMVGQGAAGIDSADLQRAVGQRPEAAAAADVGNLEPDAFLGADAHHHDVAVRRQAHRAQRAHRRQSGQHARGAVEVAAMRHRIQMRADHQHRRRPVAPGQGHVQIGRVVVTDFQPEALRQPWSPWRAPAAHPRRTDRATRPAHPTHPAAVARTAPPSWRVARGQLP